MDDFKTFLREIGLTQEQMDAAEKEMPEPLSKGDGEQYEIRPSATHGAGCFATDHIYGLIGRLRTGNEWHVAGRYINHSATPNARAEMKGGAIFAFGAVGRGEEITLDYRQVRSCITGES